VDDLLRPMVRTLVRAAKPASEAGAFRVVTTLRRLAEQTGLSMLEAHRALHQLLDRKLLSLADDVLLVPDLEALTASLEGVD
jgi:DNA-binding IclR family transcriptional regulator